MIYIYNELYKLVFNINNLNDIMILNNLYEKY